MQDAPVPTEPEDGANDAPRRGNLRLRDAEAVATVRRDMFGDGSLLDALAGPPPMPEKAESPPDPAGPAQSAEPPAPEGPPARQGDAAAESRGDAPEAPRSSENEAQSLDAIIDSFPAEPVAGASQELGEGTAEAGLAGVPPADAAPATAMPQMGVSSLFDSLGSIDQRTNETQPTEEPPPPTAPTLDLDMSMLELRVPTRPVLVRQMPVPQSDPPAIASPNVEPPASVEPAARALEADTDVEPPASVALASEADTDEGQAGGVPDLDMSMLERPPARPVLQPVLQPAPESGPVGAGALYGESSRVLESEIAPEEPRAAEPPVHASAADTSAEAAGSAQEPDEPPPADVEGALPFTGPAPWPLFPGRHDGAGRLPDFAEYPQTGEGPSFLEPLVRSTEPSEPESAPSYAEPTVAPSFSGLVEPANDLGFSEPQVLPAYSEPAEAVARPMFDAASKIAAEAHATAEALDNLKRLLAHSTPGLHDRLEDPLRPPDHAAGLGHVRLNLHGDPTPFPTSGPAALMPMPLPVPPERSRNGGIYVLGFLTGLGLSLMAGIALYVLINLG